MSYIYTKDWFTPNAVRLEWGMEFLEEKKLFLEIGSYEGRSSVFFIERMDEGGKIICVDTWEGGKEHTEQDMTGVIDRFKHNITLASSARPEVKVEAFKSRSSNFLASLIAQEGHESFDLIYIDGSHQSHDVLTDACMSFPLLKKKGLMVFDDYAWGNAAAPLDNPKIAIDAFTTIFGPYFDLKHSGSQVILQRNRRGL